VARGVVRTSGAGGSGRRGPPSARAQTVLAWRERERSCSPGPLCGWRRTREGGASSGSCGTARGRRGPTSPSPPPCSLHGRSRRRRRGHPRRPSGFRGDDGGDEDPTARGGADLRRRRQRPTWAPIRPCSNSPRLARTPAVVFTRTTLRLAPHARGRRFIGELRNCARAEGAHVALAASVLPPRAFTATPSRPSASSEWFPGRQPAAPERRRACEQGSTRIRLGEAGTFGVRSTDHSSDIRGRGEGVLRWAPRRRGWRGPPRPRAVPQLPDGAPRSRARRQPQDRPHGHDRSRSRQARTV